MKKLLIIGISVLAIGCVGIFVGRTVSAIGLSYYDDTLGSDNMCDIDTKDAPFNPVCNSGSKIWLISGQTSFVHKTATYLTAYFINPNGGTVKIYNANFCGDFGPDQIQPNDLGDGSPPDIGYGHAITSFNLSPSVGNSVSGPGKNFQPDNPNCQASNNVVTISLPNPAAVVDGKGNPVTVKKGGQTYNLYSVKIKITYDDQFPDKDGNCDGGGSCDGYLNAFSAQEVDTASSFAITQNSDDNGTGYGVTAQEGPAGGLANLSYAVRFGADCSVTSDRTARLFFYDMDNGGGGGAQQNGPIKMYLKNVTTGNWVTISGPNGTGTGPPNGYQPPSAPNQNGSVSFTVKPGNKYIWYISNVYFNNTMQFSTPFDGIYYLAGCSTGSQPPTGSLTVSCSNPALNEQTATYTYSDPDGPTTATLTIGSGNPIKLPKAQQGSGSYQFRAPAYSPENVVLDIDNVNQDGSSGGADKIITAQTDVPCGQISCTISISPRNIDPDSNLNVTMDGQAQAGTINDPTLELVITRPPSTQKLYDQQFHQGGAVTGDDFNHTFDVGKLSQLDPANQGTGIYAFGGTFSFTTSGGTRLSTDCDKQKPLSAFLPFFSVYGGDTEAGQYLAMDEDGNQSCQTEQSGYVAWNNDGSDPDNPYSGAGSQIAAFASGRIRSFATGQNIFTTNPQPPFGLSFANTSDVINPGTAFYGGLFDGSLPGAPQTCSFGAENDGPVSDFDNGMTLGQNPDGSGVTKTYYVYKQDVYLDGNITYGGSGGWSNPRQIPSFKLVVVGGNIYIGSGVNELDGLYAAEPGPNGAGGKIHMCAQLAGGVPGDVPTGDSDFYSICSAQQLRVFGSFYAKHIDFHRAFSTLSQAAGNTWDNSKAAEEFIYGPEMWLPRGNGNGSLNYASVTGLPPVL